MIKYSKDILVYKASQKLDLYNEEEKNQIKNLSEKVSKEKLIDLVYQLSELENDIKWLTQKTIVFQAGMIKLCNKKYESDTDLKQRIEKIENYLKSGKGVSRQVSPAQNVAQSGPRMTVSNNIQNNHTKQVATNIQNNTTKKFSNKSEEYWPQIINDLKQSGKIVLYTNLMNTKAKEINDMTVGIEFPNGMTSFGRTVLEKQENVREISNLVSIACGIEMQIKYITQDNQAQQMNQEESLQNLANESDIPFNIIE